MNQDSILTHSCWYLPNDLKTSKWATSFAHQAAHSPMRTPRPSRPFRLTIILFTTTWSMRARHGHTAPVVHGLQVLAFTAPGATLFPQYIGDVFIAFTELSCKFLKEVHSGDTLYSSLEIIDLSKQGPNGLVTTKVTVFNQRKELVLLGEHKYLLKAS